jgi:hypothetical protein
LVVAVIPVAAVGAEEALAVVVLAALAVEALVAVEQAGVGSVVSKKINPP